MYIHAGSKVYFPNQQALISIRASPLLLAAAHRRRYSRRRRPRSTSCLSFDLHHTPRSSLLRFPGLAAPSPSSDRGARSAARLRRRRTIATTGRRRPSSPRLPPCLLGFAAVRSCIRPGMRSGTGNRPGEMDRWRPRRTLAATGRWRPSRAAADHPELPPRLLCFAAEGDAACVGRGWTQ